MSHKLSHSQILEELPAYVLGALEPEEMLAIDNYLQDNPEPSLLARLVELEGTVVALAVTVPDVPLPPSAKTLLLERVQADLAVHHQHQRKLPQAATISEQQPNIFSRFGMWLNELFSAGTRPLAWAAVGALTVMLLAGSTIYQLQQDLTQSQAELQVLERELSSAEVQLETLQSNIEELESLNHELQQVNDALKQEQLDSQKQLAVLTTQQHQVSLAGTDEAPNATGTLFFTESEGLLILDGLMPLPEEQDYQVWLIPSDGAPEPGKLIEIASETTSQLIELPGNPLDYAAFGISQEPSGGSDSPTLVVMVGAIEQ